MREGARFVVTALVLTAACIAAGPAAGQQEIPNPTEHFGFTPGADRELVDYGQLIDYLRVLATSTPRIELREVGSSPLGKPMYVLLISSENNMARLDDLVEINRRLALDPSIPDEDRSQLVADGRVFVIATLSMHSGEVAPSQSLPLWAHRMATTDDPEVLANLENVVQMIVPSHNPDGMDMVVEHYRKYVGTKYEGSSLPRVYHEYVGHDNNRDFVALTQEDTRVIARLYSTEWYPQVLVEKHQMGSTGPRYFVPPNHDPIAENIDEGLWNWSAVFGANLQRDMTSDGLQGIASHWLFDDYWPGSTETSHWKNIISFLTEAASCRVASPVFVEPTELTVRGKGLSEYKKGINLPDPWPGGTWRLGDIVQYELSSMSSILATASRHRGEILRFRNDLCRKEVEKGRTQPPYYFVLPGEQSDPGEAAAMVRLLEEHGVEVMRLSGDSVVGEHHFAAGDFVVPLAQPYRAFVKEVMEPQRYPERHYTPDGELIRPYDITSWSLPLHMGVRAVQVNTRSRDLEAKLEPISGGSESVSVEWPEGTRAVAFLPTRNDSYRAAFAALSDGLEVRRLTRPKTLEDGTEIPAGSFIVPTEGGSARAVQELTENMIEPPLTIGDPAFADTYRLRLPRIGLVETSFHDMDAGWTRFLFDSYGIPFRALHPGDIEGADLPANFDVVVFPSANKDILTKGKFKRGDRYLANDFPPEYRRPISKSGLRKLTAFIEGGGIVVSWGDSVSLFTEGLPASPGEPEGETVDLPVRDVSKSLGGEVLVPGAFLAVDYQTDHPLTWGMPRHGGAFSRGTPVFATSIPYLGMDRRVVAVYPERTLLLSGYLDGEKQLQNRPVVVWVKVGTGQLALFGIRPQFRGSTPATFKLVFNSLLLPPIPD